MKRRKQINTEINPVLHKRLKIRLAQEDCSYRQWLEDRTIEWISDPNKAKASQGQTEQGGKENAQRKV